MKSQSLFSLFLVISFLQATLITHLHAASTDETLDVQIIDPSIPKEALEGPGLTVHTRDRLPQSKKTSQVPLPEARDKIFESAGLTSFVKDWDHLDKDLLFQRAREFELERLSRSYPKIPQDKLKLLSELTRNSGAKP